MTCALIVSVMNYDMCYELKYASTGNVLHVLNVPVRYYSFL